MLGKPFFYDSRLSLCRTKTPPLNDGWRALKPAGFAYRIRMIVCSTPAAARHQCIGDVWIHGVAIDMFFYCFPLQTCLQFDSPKVGLIYLDIFIFDRPFRQIQGFVENVWNESCQLNALRSLSISLSYRSRCWRVEGSLGLLLRGLEKNQFISLFMSYFGEDGGRLKPVTLR